LLFSVSLSPDQRQIDLSAEDYERLERRRPAQPLPQWVTTLVWIVALLLLLFVLNGIVDLRGMLEGLR
jgi:hypothetical protein